MFIIHALWFITSLFIPLLSGLFSLYLFHFSLAFYPSIYCNALWFITPLFIPLLSGLFYFCLFHFSLAFYPSIYFTTLWLLPPLFISLLSVLLPFYLFHYCSLPLYIFLSSLVSSNKTLYLKR